MIRRREGALELLRIHGRWRAFAHGRDFVMPVTDISAEDNDQLLVPPDAMKIVALERQQLHEKTLHLRALREAAEAGGAPTATETKSP
jgi:hypothetical protein